MYIKQQLTLLSILLLFIATLPASGHSSSPLSHQNYLDNFERAADSLFKGKKSIQPDVVKQKLNTAKTAPTLQLQRPHTKNIDAAQVYKNSKPAVLLIGMLYRRPTDSLFIKNFASGYVIDPSGICVTNYHVIATYSNSPKDADYVFLAQDGSGVQYAIQDILYSSPEEDLAIIQLDLGAKKEPLPVLPLVNEEPEVGDPVYVLSNPEGMYFYFSEGILANKHTYNANIQNEARRVDRKMYAITADYAVGSSGGPILDAKGNVIATVSSTKIIAPQVAGAGTQMVIKNVVPTTALKTIIKKK